MKISPVKLVKESKKNVLQASIQSLQPKGAGRKDKGREVQTNTISLLRAVEWSSQRDAECKGKNQLLIFPPIIQTSTEILVFPLCYETDWSEVVVAITLSLARSVVGGGRNCGLSPLNKGSSSSITSGSQDAKRLVQNFLTACLTRSYNFKVKMVPVCLEVGRSCFVFIWILLFMANV